ncbi:hypothetical protein GR183_20855 [Stappia sp. GBMRC 2046]|uniref:Uncharacterized protein n=1 Tax=Stappia sediminis TaxID=2692190 RepID=A0A7X3S9Z6_9HYPH|nr:hypothetical protein [Stappia sediminis]MXN67364.1 hypothetical protein [Stappia sediminis]
MNLENIEVYCPRGVSNLGQWEIGGLQFKIYGLVAEEKTIDETTVSFAQSFVREEVVPLVEDEGDDNGMGFVIIHPGELGISIAAHWWIQGSVLCQHIYRKQYSASEPMDTVKRPAIACVWELALINAEQEAWRKTMMNSQPSPSAYMAIRADFEAA